MDSSPVKTYYRASLLCSTHLSLLCGTPTYVPVFRHARLHMLQELEEGMKKLMSTEAPVAQISILGSWEARFELTQVSFYGNNCYHILHLIYVTSIRVFVLALKRRDCSRHRFHYMYMHTCHCSLQKFV